MDKIGVVIALSVSALLVGCAATPESIQPSYESYVPYESWTCQQLGEEEGRLQAALVQASGQQNQARANDTAGVILLGLPVGSMSGGNVAPEVAHLKGEINAVQQAENLKSCSRPSPPPAMPAQSAQ